MANQYDPKKVHVVIDGELATGFAEDSIVSCERLEDEVELHKGAQGEGTFTVNANDGGQITLSFAHNSPTLQTIDSLRRARKEFAVNIMDINGDGNQTAGGSEAMVSSMGSMSREGSVSDREITLLVNNYDETIL